MEEIWKPIDEFPNYSVSNLGRVRNNKRDYILIGGSDKNGYRQVTLSKGDKQYNRRVCRLVAMAFIPNPNNLPQVNHKDEIVFNDNVDNLEWCTALYNNNYGNRLNKTRKKVKCVENDIVYAGLREASRAIGICHQNIGKACKNGNRAGGYHWSYVS